MTKPNLPALITEYEELGAWMETARAKRSELKAQIVALTVSKPKEGTNHVEIPGFALTYNHKIDRKVDREVFLSLEKDMVRAKIPVDDLLRWKADLVLKEYRLLQPPQLRIFDKCLTIKPASGDLTIEPIIPA